MKTQGFSLLAAAAAVAADVVELPTQYTADVSFHIPYVRLRREKMTESLVTPPLPYPPPPPPPQIPFTESLVATVDESAGKMRTDFFGGLDSYIFSKTGSSFALKLDL